MAVTVISGPSGLFDPYTRDQASAKHVLNLALFGGEKMPGETDAAYRKRVVTAETWISRRPDFVLSASTTEAADALALDLTAKGVTFPAGSQRVIEVELFITGGTVATESGYIHRREMIVGGTTPTLGIVIGAIDTNMAGAVGGFTTADPTLTFALATNNVTVVATAENAAEPNMWLMRVYVHPLQPLRIPAS